MTENDFCRKIWSVDEVRQTALSMGKLFNPARDLRGRLEQDLKEGALVLFDEKQVASAIEEGFVPARWRNGLTRLVRERNDIAVIPKGNLGRQ